MFMLLQKEQCCLSQVEAVNCFFKKMLTPSFLSLHRDMDRFVEMETHGVGVPVYNEQILLLAHAGHVASVRNRCVTLNYSHFGAACYIVYPRIC